MATLTGQSIASSYEQLLHVDNDGGGNRTTHVAVKDGDNGTTFPITLATDAIMITSTNRLEFGDDGTYIHQSADGVLDLVSDTEIEINATTIDMNGALDLSGSGTIGGSLGIGIAAPTDSIVKIQNDTSGDNSLFVNHRVADVGVYIQHDGTHSNPNGGLLKVYSNSASGGTRNLVEFVNDHTSADACTVLKIQNDGDAPAIDVDGTLQVSKSGSATSTMSFVPSTSQSSQIKFFQDDGTTQDARIFAPEGATKLAFEAGTTEIMRMSSTGIGINIATPDTLLHVYKADASATAHSDSLFAIENSGHTYMSILSGNSSHGQIHFGDDGQNDDGVVGYDQATSKFYVLTNHSTTKRLVVDANGNTGLNITPDSTWLSTRTALQIGGSGCIFGRTSAGADGDLSIGQNVYQHSGGSFRRLDEDEASLYQQSAGKHTFKVAGSSTDNSTISFTDALTVNNSAVVELNQGQLKFPETQNASSDANTLDDYEEGVHTVSGTDDSGTFTLQSGGDTLSYTKIGRQVTVAGELQINDLSSAGSGGLRFSLPFAVADQTETGDRFVGTVQTRNVDYSADVVSACVKAVVGTQYFFVVEIKDNAVESALAAGSFATNDEVTVTLTYFTS